MEMYDTPATAEASVVFLLVFYLVFYVLMLAFAVVSYILQGKGMYAIAKRRGIRKPWLAWVPVGNMWMLGCISDQYRYAAQGQEKSKRKVLMGLGIAILAAAVVMCVLAGVLVGMAVNMEHMDYMTEEAMIMELMAIVLPIYGLLLVMSVLAIIYSVFYYMALFDLYRSCDPKTSILFLMLSIFVGLPQPFFVYACRNKDLGMPPRQDALPAQTS